MALMSRVLRVAGLEGADPAFAEDDVLVAAAHDVFGRHQQLVDRVGKAALEQNRLADAAKLLEQFEVLHVARADLDDVDKFHEQLKLGRVGDFGNNRQAGRLAGSLHVHQAFGFQSLERIRRGARFERAAAQQRGA